MENSDLNEWVIAIPSYKRLNKIKSHTLALLNKHNISQNKIFIFLSDDIEYDLYKNEIGGDYNYIIGVPLIHKQRNFINHYFPVGCKIISIDDDIKEVTELLNGNLIPIPNLPLFFTYAFEKTIELGFYIWGIYPVDNAYFMKDKISVDLKYIVGAFCGVINRHDEDLMLDLEDKEDYLKSIQFYIKDGGVVRFNNIGIKTKYYGEGGLNLNPKERFEEGFKNVHILKKRYPEYLRVTDPKKNNFHWNIQLIKNPKINRDLNLG